jgi:uncharacterized membrane protein YkoI
MRKIMQSIGRTIALLVALTPVPGTLHAAAGYQQAEATALALVPGGAVMTSNLERENGRLVWLFDISIPGSRNLREIQVDASSGAVLSNTVESPIDR